MSTTEQLQQLPNDNPHFAPVDPNVVMPERVRAQMEAASALHQQVYTPSAAEPAPAAEPQPEPQPEPQAQQAEPAPQPQPEPAPQPEPTTAPKHKFEDASGEEWYRRFLSMQGRFNAAQRTIGSMEHQMAELGQELMRTQNMLTSMQTAAPQPTSYATPNNTLITNEDVEAYGEDLIDLARRAARETITPELEHLRAENQRLTQRVQNTGRRELFATLDGAVPNWRQINRSAQFNGWLRLPNIYTGQLRSAMLKAAVDGAEAPKVIALFRDFIAEANATGAEHHEPQAEPAAAQPRTPAVSLDQLAAPGRARPAAGDSQLPPEKPIYTRAEIAKFYDEKRRGMWAGREAAAQAKEADLIAAQREGRIR